MRLALKIAWEQPDLELDLGANSQEPDSDAPTGWQSVSEFTLTLQSGQTVEVKFVPCLVGDRRMHEFSFTGSVSPTGFKSHFVLAVESEKFPHPRDYAQAYAEEMVAVYEEKQPTRPKSTKRSRSIAEVERTHSPALEDDSSQESAMPKDETQEPNHTTVEVVEELSPEEESDRQRLELKVERAWDEAARALRELRERRLDRSKYKTFEEYCRDRFGFTRQSANFKIAAADVMGNLTTKSCQVFPTKETQVRPLTKLKPDEQAQVWSEAVKQNGGKVPSERVVKDAVLRHLGIVERLKQKHPSASDFAAGDVVEIKALKRSPLHPFNGMWAIVEHIGTFSYMLRLGIAKDLLQCKAEEITLIDDEYTTDIKAVAQRIAALIQFELEHVDYAIIELLQRSRKLHSTAVALLGKNGSGLWKKQLMAIEPNCLLWATSATHARVN